MVQGNGWVTPAFLLTGGFSGLGNSDLTNIQCNNAKDAEHRVLIEKTFVRAVQGHTNVAGAGMRRSDRLCGEKQYLGFFSEAAWLTYTDAVAVYYY